MQVPSVKHISNYKILLYIILYQYEPSFVKILLYKQRVCIHSSSNFRQNILEYFQNNANAVNLNNPGTNDIFLEVLIRR